MRIRKRLLEAYRWRKLVASCRLDPRDLPRPLDPPGADDFIIAGCPRTGTSLLAAVLFQPPQVVTVMEPWDGLRMPPAELFDSLRNEIETKGKLARGRLDVGALHQGSVRWQKDGAAGNPISVVPGFQLGVKWPTFWQYLQYLPDTRFVVTLRHPAEVVSSFAGTGGRLVQGLEYDVAFNAELNDSLTPATSDPATRRVLLYEYINSRIAPYLDRDNVLAVRYEKWFEDPEGLCAEVSSFLGIPTILPNVVIRRSSTRQHSPELLDLIDELAPSARTLGYDL